MGHGVGQYVATHFAPPGNQPARTDKHLAMHVAESDPAPAVTAATFVNHADLINWLADGERGLWIQANNLRWFYASFAGVCRGLNSTNSLVFDTRASSKIDRTSSVIVSGHGPCRVQTLVPSSGPSKNRNTKVVLQPQTQ
jgi:hypothetical protein